MKSMREYHDLYLKSDVLLLADVFKNFRDVCMSNYGLDPCWYYTSPGLSWDALLKTTNNYLENIKDPDMYLFFEKGTRGGISTITTRYGEANNPYMRDEYDDSKPTKYITYLDANNLYGWAMSNPLPTGGFKWMEEKELDNWRNIPCTVEVDLEYPKALGIPERTMLTTSIHSLARDSWSEKLRNLFPILMTETKVHKSTSRNKI